MNEEKISKETAPIHYADRMFGIGVGPSVSRIMFANEEPSSQGYQHAFSVVIPTPALYEICSKALSLMAKASVQSELEYAHDEFMQKLASLISPEAGESPEKSDAS